MTGTLTLLVPEAPLPISAVLTEGRALGKAGIRFGTLDNGKGNADYLLAMVTEAVKAALPVVSAVALRKSRPSEGAPKEVLDRLAAEADCVIGAMAD